MRVSLIVCTRNRAARLPEFLSHIALLEAPRGGWELVIVDNASTDSTPLVLEQFAKTVPFPVQCVHAAIPGLSRARNVGLAKARGDILVFTDDDCYPQPDYLRVLVDVLSEPGVGFVGGRVVLHDPQDARVCVRDASTPVDIAPRSVVSAGLIHGANMAVTRDVVRTVGEFDPLLGAGTRCVAGEDIDYIARAVWAGWAGRYDPRPVVAHHHGRKPGPQAERQRRGYDYGRGAYYAKQVLDARSRRAYLSRWYWDARHHIRARQIGRLCREIVGGAYYATQRFAGLARRRDVAGRELADGPAATV